jgi:hypothetical protein
MWGDAHERAAGGRDHRGDRAGLGHRALDGSAHGAQIPEGGTGIVAAAQLQGEARA